MTAPSAGAVETLWRPAECAAAFTQAARRARAEGAALGLGGGVGALGCCAAAGAVAVAMAIMGIEGGVGAG